MHLWKSENLNGEISRNIWSATTRRRFLCEAGYEIRVPNGLMGIDVRGQYSGS